ncbi:UBX domain-containing protein 6 isoform X3 [Hyaena hyaena]|uniref:UBX domain-containing protein 6 isoform X3 n=1 Tax=Hyaena hyaena TaxID=95912 RepID=UPI00192216D1|nr:UBX domain-containing protein 6 isoform X3 [Hyaena hyaena]
MKKFFQEIKADIKFKSAGPGQKLTESVGERAPREKPNQPALRQPRQGPTDEAQMAAAAALARLEQKQPRARGPTSQESIRNQVRKELRAEATVSGSLEAPGTNMHFSTDPVAASIMKIHTFNRDRDKVKLGVDTIAKYLDNICLHPEEEKYRKIKLQNRVFQERINCLEGTHEFFEAIGFQKALLPVPDQEGPEEFYVLSEAALAQPQSLQTHKEQLLVAEPVRASLARQRRVFQPSPLASQFDLPGDFFNLTAEEIKREQRLRSEAVERLSVLRTKAMREREEQREMRRYTYTLLRVRFPDGCLLQGTFYARERVAALYAFVREALQSDWLPFELLASGGQKLSEEESLAFNECGLVPSALLTFSWDAAVLEDIRAAGAEPDSSILKPELLSVIEKLS